MSAALPYVWATDLDLHRAQPEVAARFLDQLRSARAHRVLLGGGVSRAPDLAHWLVAIADAAACPVSFVLAPGDYSGGDLAQVRADLSALVRTDPRLDWLSLGHVVPLDAGRALVGHGGWGDTLALSPEADLPPTALDTQILGRPLHALPPELLRRQLLALGADARDRLHAPLDQAAARFREVVVLTHVPPVACGLGPPCAESLAHGVCGAVRSLLLDAADRWPDTRFRVLCGSTDVPALLDLRPNLRVEAAGLRHTPGIARSLAWWPLPERPPRPVDGDGPAPVRPVEEAATVQLQPVSPDRSPRPADSRADRARVLELLDELSAGAPDRTYPFTHGETATAWSAGFRAAVATLRTDPRLGDVDHGGTPLVRWLYHLCRGPLSPVLTRDVGRVRLVGDLVRNVVSPGRINQGRKGTCAVTAVESWLAERHPAEYARVVAGLVRPEGRVLLYNGEPMVRDEERMLWSPMEGERSPTSRIFQVAGMEYADPDTDYCNAEDTHYEVNTQGLSIPAGTGLGLSAFDRLLEGLTGEIWRVLTDQDDRVATALEALGLPTDGRLRLARDCGPILERVTTAGDAAFATLSSPTSDAADAERRSGVAPVALPHKVRVLSIEATSRRVHFEDPFDPDEPWIPGVQTTLHDAFGHCSMAWADFLPLVVELSFQPRHAVDLPTAP